LIATGTVFLVVPFTLADTKKHALELEMDSDNIVV